MKNIIYLFGVLLGVLLLSSCGILAPFKERNETVKNIGKAETVEAEKYAYDDFYQSKSLLKEANTLIVSNKKSTANVKAKKILEKAILLSGQSYSNAIKPHTENILKITDENIEGAKQNKADVAFEKEFSDIFQDHSKNKSFYEVEKYEEILSTSIDVREKAISLNEKVADLKKLAADLNIMGGELVSKATALKVHIAVSNEFEMVKKKLELSREFTGKGKYHDTTNLLKTFPKEINRLIQVTEEKKKLSIISYAEANTKLSDFKRNQKIQGTNSLKSQNINNRLEKSLKNRKNDKLNTKTNNDVDIIKE